MIVKCKTTEGQEVYIDTYHIRMVKCSPPEGVRVFWRNGDNEFFAADAAEAIVAAMDTEKLNREEDCKDLHYNGLVNSAFGRNKGHGECGSLCSCGDKTEGSSDVTNKISEDFSDAIDRIRNLISEAYGNEVTGGTIGGIPCQSKNTKTE